ncbi:MAG: KilA-N domain-containing protein, partial [Fusobacterium sp.]|nr:KilA-N domain-containing protein [Fusobacterium sp.]
VYANATSMCKAFEKQPSDWLKIKSTQEYIDELNRSEDFPNGLVKVVQGGNDKSKQGTWIHEKLILDLARWLNVKFRVWCDEQIATLLREGEVKIKPASETQIKNLEIRERYSKVKMAEALKSLIPYAYSERYKEILIAESAKVLTGKEILPPQEVEEKTLTATEIGEILGISANKVGTLANKHNLKTEKNGYWVHEKAKHCNKEIPNFRYFKSAIEEFKKILSGGN